MTSKEMKLYCLRWLLFHKNCHCAFTEYRFADVYGVNGSDYPIEVEIKTSKADFMSEWRTVEYMLDWTSDKGFIPGRAGAHPKFDKHRSYLFDEAKHTPRPRYFYFAVPYDLKDFAMEQFRKQRTKDESTPCPYGLVVVTHFGMEVLGAQKISDKKYEPSNYKVLARKASNEILELRKQVLNFEIAPRHIQ